MDSEYVPLSRIRVPQIAGDDAPELTEGVPLAKVIKRELVRNSRLVLAQRKRSETTDGLRRLKHALLGMADDPPQAIVVASPGAGDGRSFVALNLALALAGDASRHVLLIDADLRQPSIGASLSPAPVLGFSEVIDGRTGLEHAILDLVDSPLRILPAGAPRRSPEELLASEHTKAVLCDLRARFDTIVIDTPPILPFPDADIIGQLSDGFLLLARAGATERSAFLRARSRVTSKPVLGAVLNGTVR